MILVLADKIDLGRYIEIYKIANRKGAWAERVVRIGWGSCDLSSPKGGETLYISAHGSNADVEGRDPEALAKELVAKGLKEGVSLKKIKLMSCGSGITSGSNVPFCLRFANELAAAGGPKSVTVVGFDGQTTVCDEKGAILAKDVKQATYPNYSEYTKLHQPHYAKWNTTAEELPCGDELELQKNAKLLWDVPEVQSVFGWLYENNKKHTKVSTEGKTFASADKPASWKK
jgi:hypothetical protein